MQDYYAFGMQMPGRKSSGGYRYGFNGKENDNEVKGEGNQIDYGLRIYDPRIIRFLSVDPLFEQYPWYTSYQFAGNSPIANVDIDGGEEEWYKLKMDSKTGKTELTLTKKKEERSVLWGLVKWTGPETKYVEYNNSNYTFIKGQNGDHDYGDFNAFVNNPDAYLANTWHSSDEEQFEEFAIQGGAAIYFGSVLAYRNIGSKSVTTPKSQEQSETPPAQQNRPSFQQKAAVETNGAKTSSKVVAAEKKLANAAEGKKSSGGTDFIVTKKGEAIPIPNGAKGPNAPNTGSGMSYQGGSGGKGMDSKTTGVRIMDANKSQGNRVNYMNKSGQTVDPKSGKTISNSDPRGHLPLKQ